MNEQEFTRLIKKESYQIFLFSSNIALPLSFITHSWIVVAKKGKITRYDVIHKGQNGNHLYRNIFRPWEGLGIIFWNSVPRWKSQLLGKVEGGKGSIAEKIVLFIEKSSRYPFKKKYHFFPGPNSNTFTQWIITMFPGCGLQLPWSALGKNYLSLEKRLSF